MRSRLFTAGLPPKRRSRPVPEQKKKIKLMQRGAHYSHILTVGDDNAQ